jgi:enolase-phosphatase E1
MTTRAIVTDIEGTTSSIDFVHKVLFPYAGRELPGYVRAHRADPHVASILDDVRQEANEPDADVETIIEILLGWIVEDRKTTALKTLQGHVWKHGYENGDFTGHIYDDAVRCLRKWFDDGIALYVYSSGSVGAQKLLFGHSDAGDLCPVFRGYFDTQIGHKREADAYRNISRQIALPAEDILFLSDILEELDAAAEAGMQTMQLVRNQDVVTGSHRIVHDFHEVVLS